MELFKGVGARVGAGGDTAGSSFFSFWARLALLLIAIGAGSGESVTAAEPENSEDRIVAIQDSAARMPAEWFRDVGDCGFVQTEPDYAASVNVFLLQKDGKKYLIDTGYGPPRGLLAEKLRELGVEPGEIAGIFLTHLHPDHVGGLAGPGERGLVAAYPNAEVFLARVEYEAWKRDPARAGLGTYLALYPEKLRLFEYGQVLPGGMVPLRKEGHTPGHTVYRLNAECWFVGDILHAADLQGPYPTYCAKFDGDPKTAVKSRVDVLTHCRGELWGAHFPYPGRVRAKRLSRPGETACFGLEPLPESEESAPEK